MNNQNSNRYRVAFQGELGAYSEGAIRLFFGSAADPVACRDFASVGSAVVSSEVDFGLLPVENSLAGSVVGSYDVLGSRDLVAVGEVVSPIHHLVLGVPGAKLETVERIISHPVALAQCTRFLEEHSRAAAVSFYDTAGAAREIAEQKDPAVAAIAGQPAADRYGLEVLADHVEDRSDNQTRFLVVARPDRSDTPRAHQDLPTAWKTTLLLETSNSPGALVNVLLPFADRAINLLKLESRPGEKPWTYRFFVDLEGAADDETLRDALSTVEENTERLRVVGSYPRWDGPGG
ncbi:MAG TPA: prephenate dehydratase [Longimicrobiaceae bacterium]|nr:prephenate dehydratase [Longimicrobiaceae bacterium]